MSGLQWARDLQLELEMLLERGCSDLPGILSRMSSPPAKDMRATGESSEPYTAVTPARAARKIELFMFKITSVRAK
jgi:hypothetical protein